MSTQDAQLLLQRYLAGECTAEEKDLLEAWWDELLAEYEWQISEAQENVVHDRMLSRIKAELGEELGTAGREEKAGREEFENGAPVRRLQWRRYAGIAAAVLVIAGGGWLGGGRHGARRG